MRRILYTNPDRSVALVAPSARCLRVLTGGGVGKRDSVFYWRMRVRGWVEEQVRRWEADGKSPDTARRWVRAMQSGGCTTAEALGLILAKDVPVECKGNAELIDVAELPDRWFRDAWVRGHNGGPPSIDLDRARPIQARKILTRAKRLKRAAERERTLELMLGEIPDPVASLPWGRLRDHIQAAHDEAALKAVWPFPGGAA